LIYLDCPTLLSSKHPVASDHVASALFAFLSAGTSAVTILRMGTEGQLQKGKTRRSQGFTDPWTEGWDQPIDFQPFMAHLQRWAPACSAKHVGKRSYFKFNDIQSTKIFKVQGNIFEMFLVTTPVRWQDVEHRAHRRSCSAVGQNK
jgi:hypothetical protein